MEKEKNISPEDLDLFHVVDTSEEALAACEGLIFNVPLNGGTQCTPNASLATLANIRTSVELEVSETGFYYFIFANENEMTDNFLSAKFDLHKTVFDVSNNAKNCTDSNGLGPMGPKIVLVPVLAQAQFCGPQGPIGGQHAGRRLDER